MPFQRGQSGNPAGRKAGQPNALTLAARAQIAAGTNPLGFLQKIVAGDYVQQADNIPILPTLEQRIKAAITLANKLLPDARDAHVQFEIGLLDGPDAALKATAAVAERMAAGEITPGEASAAINVIGQYAKTYELTELVRRIESLEAVSAPAPRPVTP